MGCGQLQLQRCNGYSNNVKHVNRYQEGLTAAVYASRLSMHVCVCHHVVVHLSTQVHTQKNAFKYMAL